MFRILTSLSFILVFVLVTSSCERPGCYKVKGPVTQWEYYIADFSKIRVFNDPQVYIAQGDSQSVVVESEENMFHTLLFHIDPFEERLFVDFDELCVYDIDHFKIYITVDTLKEVDMRGGGEVFVEDTMCTDELNVLIPGSTNVNLSKLSARSVSTAISGSGNLSCHGIDTVSHHSIDILGSGSVHSFDLLTNNVAVNISGSGSIEITVTDTLNVTISGSGYVYYRGYPIINQQISSSGQLIDSN